LEGECDIIPSTYETEQTNIMPQNSSKGKKKNGGDRDITISGNVTNSTIIIWDTNWE